MIMVDFQDDRNLDTTNNIRDIIAKLKQQKQSQLHSSSILRDIRNRRCTPTKSNVKVERIDSSMKENVSRKINHCLQSKNSRITDYFDSVKTENEIFRKHNEEVNCEKLKQTTRKHVYDTTNIDEVQCKKLKLPEELEIDQKFNIGTSNRYIMETKLDSCTKVNETNIKLDTSREIVRKTSGNQKIYKKKSSKLNDDVDKAQSNITDYFVVKKKINKNNIALHESKANNLQNTLINKEDNKEKYVKHNRNLSEEKNACFFSFLEENYENDYKNESSLSWNNVLNSKYVKKQCKNPGTNKSNTKNVTVTEIDTNENKTNFDDFCKNIISTIDCSKQRFELKTNMPKEYYEGEQEILEKDEKIQKKYVLRDITQKMKNRELIKKSYSTGNAVKRNNSTININSLPITNKEISTVTDKLAVNSRTITFDDFIKNILQNIDPASKNVDIHTEINQYNIKTKHQEVKSEGDIKGIKLILKRLKEAKSTMEEVQVKGNRLFENEDGIISQTQDTVDNLEKNVLDSNHVSNNLKPKFNNFENFHNTQVISRRKDIAKNLDKNINLSENVFKKPYELQHVKSIDDKRIIKKNKVNNITGNNSKKAELIEEKMVSKCEQTYCKNSDSKTCLNILPKGTQSISVYSDKIFQELESHMVNQNNLSTSNLGQTLGTVLNYKEKIISQHVYDDYLNNEVSDIENISNCDQSSNESVDFLKFFSNNYNDVSGDNYNEENENGINALNSLPQKEYKSRKLFTEHIFQENKLQTTVRCKFKQNENKTTVENVKLLQSSQEANNSKINKVVSGEIAKKLTTENTIEYVCKTSSQTSTNENSNETEKSLKYKPHNSLNSTINFKDSSREMDKPLNDYSDNIAYMWDFTECYDSQTYINESDIKCGSNGILNDCSKTQTIVKNNQNEDGQEVVLDMVKPNHCMTKKIQQSNSNNTEEKISCKSIDEFIEELLDPNTTQMNIHDRNTIAQPKKCYIKRYRKGKTKIFRLKKLKKLPIKTQPAKEDDSELNFQDVLKKLTQNFVETDDHLNRSKSMSSISTSSSYVTDETKSTVLSTGSNELISPDKRLRKGFNELSKDKSLRHNGKHLYDMVDHKKDVIKMKIQEIFLQVLEDFKLKNSSALKIRTQSFKNCIFKDGRLQLRPLSESAMTVISSKAKRSQVKFKLILYIMNKIQTLLETDTKLTKRELYYQLKTFISDQQETDRAINAISCLLDVGMWTLNIIAQKGLVFGNMKILLSSGETLNCNIPGTLIPQDISDIVEIQSSAYFILVVEKESIFYKLIEEDLPNRLTRPFIMITGKGFPDLNTLLFLKKLWIIMSIPVFILVDADPHGINIMLNYRFGSVKNAHVSQYLAVPNAKWLGVYPSEVINLDLTREPLSDREIKLVHHLLHTPYMEGNPAIVKELQVLLEKKYKAEIEGLIKSNTYLSEVYLPNKFFNHNFI